MFSQAGGKPAAIIVCGGPTNGLPPFDATEAAGMAEYLGELRNRESMLGQCDAWTIYQEGESLSSLENLVFAKRLMTRENLEGSITIFCEATRETRIQETGRLIFGEVKIQAIDFDVTKNRYLDSAVTQQREDLALQEALWTLQDDTRLASHHAFYEKKFAWFREQAAQGIPHVDSIEAWYKTKLHELVHECMPNHPMFRNQPKTTLHRM
jgi:hypothetical protein